MSPCLFLLSHAPGDPPSPSRERNITDHLKTTVFFKGIIGGTVATKVNVASSNVEEKEEYGFKIYIPGNYFMDH